MKRYLPILLAVATVMPTIAAAQDSRPLRSDRRAERPGRETQSLRGQKEAKSQKQQRDVRSRRLWKDLRKDRVRRFRRGGSGPVHPGPYYGSGRFHEYGYGYSDITDYAEIYHNQSYFDDGPYGPGFYDRNRWYNWYVATQRADQLRETSRRNADKGMQAFRTGHYDRAVIAWLGASKANEGDATSRVHAGHALFAVGRYDAAVKLISRGFELAPRLATSDYDIRSDYGRREDFDKHLKTLEAYVVARPNNADAVALLGYVRFYSEGPAKAHRVLLRAAELRKDYFVPKLLEVSRSVTPMGGVEKDPAEKSQKSNLRQRPGDRSGQKPKIKKIGFDE